MQQLAALLVAIYLTLYIHTYSHYTQLTFHNVNLMDSNCKQMKVTFSLNDIHKSKSLGVRIRVQRRDLLSM